jgi:hypothetical protein
MRKKIFIFASIITIMISFGSGVSTTGTNITDLYVFQGQNAADLVFIANTGPMLTPEQTANAQFDPNTLIQFNIDNNGDGVEDLVIQCIYKTDGFMYCYGPVAPTMTGLRSRIEDSSLQLRIQTTPYGAPPIFAGNNGPIFFAGARDNPFFFDQDQYNKIVSGQATAFNTVGTDYYAGTNVLSVVVEIPKLLLNIPPNGKLNVWLTIKKKI